MASGSGNGGGLRLTDFINVDVAVERWAGGGFGLVFMGPNKLEGGRWDALKTLRPDILARAPRLRELFVREGITWVSLWPHPNLLSAQAATIINAQPFLELDYASYGSLRDLLRLNQPFAVRFTWAQHVAAGLVAIHTPDPQMLRDQPLVHRDLKPENVLVDEYGYAMITDFGLAKAVEEAAAEDPGVLAALAALEQQEAIRLATAARGKDQRTRMAVAAASRSRRYQTKRGAALGTLAYMPPEQWTDAAVVGPPADIYAFGLILSELLAGRHGLLDLEAGADEHAWREVHERGKPRALRGGPAEGAARLPLEVEELYQRCLAKRPQDRPQAAECLTVLQRAAVALGDKLYEVRDTYPRTDEHIWMKLENVSITCLTFDLPDEALRWIEKALVVRGRSPKVHATHGNVLKQLALRAQENGQSEEAERLTNRALAAYSAAESGLPASHPSHWIVVGMRASLLCERGRYSEADPGYAAVLAVHPDDADTWYNRADNKRRWAISEAQAGRIEAARLQAREGLSYADRAVELNADDPLNTALQAALRQLLAQVGG